MTILFLLGQWIPFFNYYVYLYLWDFFHFFFSTCIYSFSLAKKKTTVLFLVLCFVFGCLYCLLLAYLRGLFHNDIIFQMLASLSIYLLNFLIICLCFNEKRNLKPFFCWLTAGSARELSGGLWVCLVLLCGFNPRTQMIDIFELKIFNVLLHDFCIFGMTAIPYFFFRKKFTINQDKILNRKTFGIVICFLANLVFLKTFIVCYANNDLLLYGICSVQEIFISLFFLVFRTGILNENSYRSEIHIMENVLKVEQKQYDDLRENIELVNIQAHDIKHQLDNLSSKLTKEEIDEMKKTISDYDCQSHSGNQVIDTVLYATGLKCRHYDISFTSMVDGRLFDGYSSREIYPLFSNILNNAIEATKILACKEERFISLNVRRDQDSILIEECNYFSGTLGLVQDGLLKTTKKDAKSHGYGMKSIRYIVEENDGRMKFYQKENMFFMKISIPIKTNA